MNWVGCLWIALTGIVLSGCAVERVKVQRANAIVSSTQSQESTCLSKDACAIVSPYQKLAEQALTSSTADHPVHYVNSLEQGEEALLLRVHLIRAAKKSIDLQTFIFSEDDVGHLVLDELIQAARRGVRVRVLTDQLFSLTDTTLLAQLASAHVNFTFKIYNPTFNKATIQPLEFAAGILCCFFNFNQRMHNKLLLIDDRIGIAGGRNYEDRYYDWDNEFDYRDRDALVAGPAALQMTQSFEQFWQHPRAVALTQLRDVVPRILSEAHTPISYVTPLFHKPERVATLRAQAEDSLLIEQRFASQALRVGRVEYFSDSPNKFFEKHNLAENEMTQHIVQLFRSAKQEIVIQTPYLVISKPAQRIFQELRHLYPQLRILVSTNSLAATDAFYVYALSHKYKKLYIKKFGFEIHEFKAFPGDAAQLVAHYADLAGASDDGEQLFRKCGPAPLTRQGVRLGMHAKSVVIDGAITLIGSHNFDPRSDRYNTESGFIIYDAAFAQAVRASIARDMEPQNAWVIARRPRPKLLARLNNAISDFSTALPLFDFWPFRYATSYELKPECGFLPPENEHFYECYTDVGDFPEVNLSLKTIYTRIVTAFGASLVSIL